MAANYTIFTKFAAVDAMSATLNKIQGRVAAMTTSLNKAQTSTGNVLKGLGDQAIMRGIGLAAIGSGILLKNAIQTAAEFESIKTAISFASGGGENAAKNLQFLSETVKNLNVDYSVTAEGFKRFLGAMRSTNIEADKQREMFYKMASATKVMGLNSESTERVFYALGEMFSKGQVMSQELKLQLGNAMPGAVADFAASMKKPQAEFRKLMEAGKVGTEHIAGYIDFIYEKTKGGVEAASRTMLSQLTALDTSWKMMLEQIGIALNDAGVLDTLTKIMSGVRDWVEANKELIKSGFKEFLDSLVVGFKWIYNNWDAIVVGLKVWLGAWAYLKIVNTGLNLMITSLKMIEILSGPTGWIITGVALLAAYFLDSSISAASTAENAKKIGDNMNYSRHQIKGVSTEIQDMQDTFFRGSQKTKTTWAEDWNDIVETVLRAVQLITNAISYIPGNLGVLGQNGSDGLERMILENKRSLNEKLGFGRTPIDQTSEVATRTQKYLMTQESTDYNRGWGVTLPQTQSGTPEYAPGSKSYGDLIPATSYLSQGNREGVLEILIKSDKDTTAEVVKSSGAMPVSVTINNK